MAANEVLQERRGQALILTFNRPAQANALTMDMANQLFLILKNAVTDRSIRAVMLRGAGNNFMNGVDMGIYANDINVGLEQTNQMILPYHSCIRELQAMDKPVLAVVDGHAAGSGLSFVLASDLVISSQSAVFHCRFPSEALSPTGGLTYFLPRKIGASRALEMMLLDEPIDAARAMQLEMVHRVVDDNCLQYMALEWLDRLANGPTMAYGAIKKLTMKAFDQDMNAHLGLEHTYLGHASRSFDFREAVKAHKEGRKAKFSGT